MRSAVLASLRSPLCEAERRELIRRRGPIIRRSSKFVHGTFALLLYASAAFGAGGQCVEGALGKNVAGGKEEGQLVLDGSRDFELCAN